MIIRVFNHEAMVKIKQGGNGTVLFFDFCREVGVVGGILQPQILFPLFQECSFRTFEQFCFHLDDTPHEKYNTFPYQVSQLPQNREGFLGLDSQKVLSPRQNFHMSPSAFHH